MCVPSAPPSINNSRLIGVRIQIKIRFDSFDVFGSNSRCRQPNCLAVKSAREFIVVFKCQLKRFLHHWRMAKMRESLTPLSRETDISINHLLVGCRVCSISLRMWRLVFYQIDGTHTRKHPQKHTQAAQWLQSSKTTLSVFFLPRTKTVALSSKAWYLSFIETSAIGRRLSLCLLRCILARLFSLPDAQIQ